MLSTKKRWGAGSTRPRLFDSNLGFQRKINMQIFLRILWKCRPLPFLFQNLLSGRSSQTGNHLCMAEGHGEFSLRYQPQWLQHSFEKIHVRNDTFIRLVGRKWVFPKIGVPQNGWFIVENPIKMDDLGVSLFLQTPKYQSTLTLWRNPWRVFFWTFLPW